MFKVGDTVRVKPGVGFGDVSTLESSKYVGVVRHIIGGDCNTGVAFKVNVGGHDLDAKFGCEYGNGWYFFEEDLILISEDVNINLDDLI